MGWYGLLSVSHECWVLTRSLDEPCSSQVKAFVHEQLLKISIISCCLAFGGGHCGRRLQPVNKIRQGFSCQMVFFFFFFFFFFLEFMIRESHRSLVRCSGSD